MAWQYIDVSHRGRVAVVRFGRSDHLNALSRDLIAELTEVARSFEADHHTTAVVLSGAESHFSAGLDLRDPRILELPELPLGERRRVLAMGAAMCRAWEEMEPLTIAAIEGFCIGGAVSLAVACDLRVMGAGASLRVPELGLGMNMSWQTLPRLVRLVGPARTKQIVIFAESIAPETALAWGLVDRVVGDGETRAAALALAEKAAAQPPVPVRMTKRAVNAAAGALDQVASFMDADQYALCQVSEDFREGMAAFAEKRVPRFHGR